MTKSHTRYIRIWFSNWKRSLKIKEINTLSERKEEKQGYVLNWTSFLERLIMDFERVQNRYQFDTWIDRSIEVNQYVRKRRNEMMTMRSKEEEEINSGTKDELDNPFRWLIFFIEMWQYQTEGAVDRTEMNNDKSMNLFIHFPIETIELVKIEAFFLLMFCVQIKTKSLTLTLSGRSFKSVIRTTIEKCTNYE